MCVRCAISRTESLVKVHKKIQNWNSVPIMINMENNAME